MRNTSMMSMRKIMPMNRKSGSPCLAGFHSCQATSGPYQGCLGEERIRNIKGEYERNYKRLARRLDDLHHLFKETVDNADGKSFVVSHAAFGYLANRYGLNQISISELSPSEEPSPGKLREVVETARKHRVRYILFETLVSSKVAKTVQKEVGARPLTLHPLEGLTPQEKSQGEDYFTLMEKNAKHLGKALETK